MGELKNSMSRLEYLKQYQGKSTVAGYKSALKKFFQTIYNVEKPNLEECVERYFNEHRNFEADIQAFNIALKEAPPKTRRHYTTAVKVFLLENGVELPQFFWRRLYGRGKAAGAVSEEKVPNKEQLRSIMTHLPVQGKALYLTLLSSGMRIGEALQLKLSDIDLTSDPVAVHIRAEYTKTGEKRLTFISQEAKEAIQEWLKVRSKYIEAASGKSHIHAKNVEDQRLFPFSDYNARYMWAIALKKTGNGQADPRTKRMLMRPHVLRKYFRSALGASSIDMTETLMGHHDYLTDVYRRYPDPEKTLAEFYRQNEHLLSIFSDTSKVVQKQSELEERNKQLQQIINGLVAENLELKQKMVKVENKMAEIEKMLKELAE